MVKVIPFDGLLHFSKIEKLENFRTSKNVFYMVYGLLHFENNFYNKHNVF